MKIDINLDFDDCIEILNKNGYTYEELKLYYTLDTTPYGGKLTPKDLIPVNTKVAYKERPEFLDREYPLLEDSEDYLFDKVIERLFKDMIIETIIKKD
jgi:hypothetical protein